MVLFLMFLMAVKKEDSRSWVAGEVGLRLLGSGTPPTGG